MKSLALGFWEGWNVTQFLIELRFVSAPGACKNIEQFWMLLNLQKVPVF